MDEVERQRFLETLRNDEAFREAVRHELHTEELAALPQAVATLSATTATLSATTATLSATTAAMRTDVSAVVETARNLLTTSVEGFGRLGREIAQHKADTAAGFAANGARFDQLDAAVAELKNERST